MKCRLCSMSAAKRVIIGGILTITTYGFMSIMAGSNPQPAVMPNTQHFMTAMVWSELAINQSEVFEALGDPATPKGAEIRSAVKTADTYDFLFMIAYAFFFASIALFYAGRLSSGGTSRFYFFLKRAAVIFAVIMLAGDAGENFFKFRLDAYLKPADVLPFDMTGLIVFTRIKWTMYFVLSGLTGCALMFRPGKMRFAVLGVLYFVCGAAGLCGVIVPQARFIIEYAAVGVFAAWMISLCHTAGTVFSERNTDSKRS